MGRVKTLIPRGLLLIGLVLLCGSGGPAENQPTGSQPASQPVKEPASPPADVEAVPRLDRPAEVLRLEARVSELERSVRELERYLGGPTRNLTIRPDTDLRSLQERLERQIDQLGIRMTRLQRDLDSLGRRLDRVERRR